MAEVNGYPNSDNDALPPNNPLDPRSSLLHSKSNCQAKLSTNTTTVHRKLLSACIDIWRQNTSPILWDSHQISPSPPGIKAAPAGPGEVDPRNGDSDVYKTLSLSAEMFSQHLEADNIRIDVEVVLIVIKHHDSTLPAKNRELAEWLLQTGRTVIVEDFLREHEGFDVQGLLKKHPEWAKKLEFWSPHTCLAEAENIDLVITLGGDGTVLNASNMFQRVVPPVVSFALGSFGFLTRMDFSQFRETLDEIFTKGFRVCLRSRISARIMRSIDNGVPRERRNLTEELIGSQAHEHTHELESVHSALNEVVLDRGAKSTVSYTELYSLDQHITRIIADGVMVSTPTGSTAYNLAAGGPLCHPDMSAILITPICPHSLTFRPVIVPDSMVLRLGVPYDAIHRSGINIDGRKAFELREGDYVQISVSRFPFAVVQTGDGCDREWFESISTSFNWGFRRTKA